MTSLESKTLQAQVKLVVWDLDDTFWRGTLSEGGIEYVQAHHELVIALAQRGIMSSICSKNDHETVRHQLAQHDMWRYFVFPKIAWRPKGPMLQELLDAIQLRAENVLFIDDNAMNLREAAYFCAGLQTAAPGIIAGLLEHEAVEGKPDSGLSRLAHYQVLNAKFEDRACLDVDNQAFLRQSEIRVELGSDVAVHRDRVLELIGRTNQLNYTKHRIDGTELGVLLEDPAVEAGYLRAVDRYGDYGVCGFYATRGNRLLHFLFSCRVLHMGIERWLYDQLGRPELQVVGEVAVDLDEAVEVDWVRAAKLAAAGRPQLDGRVSKVVPKVVLKGGCDLDQVVHFFRSSNAVVAEFNYPGDAGHTVRADHLEILRRHDQGIPSRYADVLRRLPFLDTDAYRTAIFDGAHDGTHQVVVYSALMDYDQGLYRFRDSDWVVPFGDYLIDVTAPRHREHVASSKPYAEGFLGWFADNFTFLGGTSTERLADNVRWLRSRLSDSQLLILLNGAELDLPHVLEPGRGSHHATMNAALEKAVDALPSTEVCDVRPFVQSVDAVVDNIRHYQRWVYLRIAERLHELVGQHGEVEAEALRVSRTWGALRGALSRWVPGFVGRHLARRVGARPLA